MNILSEHVVTWEGQPPDGRGCPEVSPPAAHPLDLTSAEPVEVAQSQIGPSN